MTYTILSAAFANAEHTAITIITQEAGAVSISEVDRPDLWALAQENAKATPIADYQAPVIQPQFDVVAEVTAIRKALVAKSVVTAVEIDAQKPVKLADAQIDALKG